MCDISTHIASSDGISEGPVPRKRVVRGPLYSVQVSPNLKYLAPYWHNFLRNKTDKFKFDLKRVASIVMEHEKNVWLMIERPRIARKRKKKKKKKKKTLVKNMIVIFLKIFVLKTWFIQIYLLFTLVCQSRNTGCLLQKVILCPNMWKNFQKIRMT